MDQLLCLVPENIGDASWAGALQQIVRRNRQNPRSLGRVLLGFHLLGGNPEILVDRGLDLGGVHSPASGTEAFDLDVLNGIAFGRLRNSLRRLALIGRGGCGLR